MFRNRAKRLETIIGKETEFRGEVAVTGTIRIDGVLEGDVRADWVVVGENGRIHGNVRSRGTICSGKIEGNICAEETAELKTGSSVSGEIQASRLIVSDGALFDGVSRMNGPRRDAAADGEVVFMEKPARPS